MLKIELLSLHELTGHDVYEFCSAEKYPLKWNENSLYLVTEEFSILELYLDEVFPNYHYYGPQKIILTEWEAVKNQYANHQSCAELDDFFMDIDIWIKKENGNYEYFWILGV